MSEDLISVIDVANQLGKHKGTIFKVLKRLGIESQKTRSATNGGPLISYITNDDFRRVNEELRSHGASNNLAQDIDGAASDVTLAEQGVFYLLLHRQHSLGIALSKLCRASLAEVARGICAIAPLGFCRV